MRLNRPIGILLLLWPTLWALWIAADGVPNILNLVIFVSGTIIMRSAGCIINDFADRDIDKYVARTKDRPITSGKVSSKEAILLFVFLSILAFSLVLFLNTNTILLSIGAIFLAVSYPFAKRITYLPQAYLGLAFGWAIPMAFCAETNNIPIIAWFIYLATLIWAIIYDTMYAMVDIDDDIKINVKSSAILFGKYDRVIIIALQISFIIIMTVAGYALEFGFCYFAGAVIASALFFYQQYLIRYRNKDACFKAFLNNNLVGATIFCAICLEHI